MPEITFSLPHISLAAIEYNPSSTGPIVLALHGWLDNANSFTPMMAHNSDIHLIALDFPGHGHSAHRGADALYNLLDYVYDIYALIKENEWGKIHLVGHSMGAIIASVFAGTFPELVGKLVLIEAMGAISSKPEETCSQLRASIVMRHKTAIKLSSNRRYESIEQAVIARMTVSDFDESIAQLLVSRSIVEDDSGFKWRSDPRLKQLSAIKMSEPQAMDLLSGITHDTLLILGDSGYKSLREQLDERMRAVKSLTLSMIRGGHHVHMEQPLKTWQLISQHIASAKS